jgi:hypothetical protein
MRFSDLLDDVPELSIGRGIRPRTQDDNDDETNDTDTICSVEHCWHIGS